MAAAAVLEGRTRASSPERLSVYGALLDTLDELLNANPGHE
jgi:hypothetical protein